MPTPVTIGDRTFPSKKAALDEYDRIRATYPFGEEIVGADRQLILDGMDCDEVGRSKKGRGVDRLFIRDIGGKRVIWLHDIDGNPTDWSPGRAVALAKTPRARAHGYLRRAIQPQIDEFRAAEFRYPQVCPLTGIRLRDDATTVTDHYDPPFVQLADLFLNQIGGPEQLAVIKRDRWPGTGVDEPHFTAWWTLHLEHAHLRLLHTSANMHRDHAGDEPVSLGEAIELLQDLLGAKAVTHRCVKCSEPTYEGHVLCPKCTTRTSIFRRTNEATNPEYCNCDDPDKQTDCPLHDADPEPLLEILREHPIPITDEEGNVLA